MLKMMRIRLMILGGAVIGAIITSLIAFVSAHPFWPPEIGFGKAAGDYFPFLSLTASVGCVLGMVSGFAIAASPARRAEAAWILIIIGGLVAALIAPITWILEENGAWPLLRASDAITATLEDFGPFIICWFPFLWGILLAVYGSQQKRNNA